MNAARLFHTLAIDGNDVSHSRVLQLTHHGCCAAIVAALRLRAPQIAICDSEFVFRVLPIVFFVMRAAVDEFYDVFIASNGVEVLDMLMTGFTNVLGISKTGYEGVVAVLKRIRNAMELIAHKRDPEAAPKAMAIKTFFGVYDGILTSPKTSRNYTTTTTTATVAAPYDDTSAEPFTHNTSPVATAFTTSFNPAQLVSDENTRAEQAYEPRTIRPRAHTIIVPNTPPSSDVSAYESSGGFESEFNSDTGATNTDSETDTRELVETKSTVERTEGV